MSNDLEKYKTEISEMTVKELWEEFKKQFFLTADHLSKAAACLVRLEKEGQSFEGFRIDHVDTIRQIANELLRPELVIKYGIGTERCKVLGKLPTVDQDRVLKNNTIPVAIVKDGIKTSWLADPMEMTTKELAAVATPHGLVSVEEQHSNNDRQNEKKSLASKRDIQCDGFPLDLERDGIDTRGAKFVSRAVMKKATRLLEKMR